MVCLHVGCGPKLLQGYINIDIDTKKEIMERYGIDENSNFSSLEVFQYDIFNLPFKNGEVDEILCEAFLEHLSFEDEKKFFDEAKRVLRVGGKIIFTVPDFDEMAKLWLNAEDNFIDFYKVGVDEHWFGNNNRNLENKWGYLTAHIYGNQNGQGQFHKNAYTVKKICSMLNLLNFSYNIYFENFKNTKIKMIRCIATQKGE
jgi:predicted SAM-dependent methyltransferase